MAKFYSPQIQMATQATTFVTTCPFLFWRNKTKCNKTSNHKIFCSDIIHFDFCSIHFPASSVYSVANNKKDSGMGAWPPYCLSSPKGQKEYWGFFFYCNAFSCLCSNYQVKNFLSVEWSTCIWRSNISKILEPTPSKVNPKLFRCQTSKNALGHLKSLRWLTK